MKRLFFSIISFSLLITACNNNKSSDATDATEDSVNNISPDAIKMQNASEEMEKKKEELSKLTPLSMDALKALIPETLLGGKRTNFDANNSMGAGLATGEYDLTDSTAISINIYDCAGSAGAGIYSMQYLSMINMEQESEDEYTKTVDFNGAKASEHCDKTTNDCTFVYFAGGRYMVTLEGDNVGAEALKQAARALNIK